MFDQAKKFIHDRLMRMGRSHLLNRQVPTAKQRPGRTEIVGYGDRVGPEFAKGFVTVEQRYVDPVTHEPGPWITVHAAANLVVTQAEIGMARMAAGIANSPLNYIELGDPAPATAPTLTDTGLQQTTGQRKLIAPTVSGNVVTCEATWLTTEGNGPTYTEAGLFTGPFAGGLMFARKTFAGITKTNAFEMRFTWLITFLISANGGDCSGIALLGPSTIASYTLYISPAGGEQSVAATFDFVPNSLLLDVFLNGQRLVPGVHYTESGAPLALPQGGGSPGVSKGIDLLFVLIATDEVLMVLRTIQ